MAEHISRRQFVLGGVYAGMLATLPACARHPEPTRSVELRLGSSERAQLTQWEGLIADLMGQAVVPGVAIALVKDGTLVWHRALGVRDAGGRQPVDERTVFAAASVSKTVFAYAVMQLHERGVLDLDTPLTRYTPDRILEGDRRLDLITARHVLSHTSGLPNFRSGSAPLRIHFAPGERFQYSGEGYWYLQSVITHLTGRVDAAQCAAYEAGMQQCATDIAAGAVIVGKQNMHEFAFGATSVPSHFGAVHNPWNLDYVAGGSSGGSAAAVAASLCYGALGSDTGGSIRQPASLCGIVGLKPTYGRVSTRGVIPLSWSLDHVGPLTRAVLDAAVLLQAIAGHDAQEATSVNRSVPDYATAVKRGASSLRVGVPREYSFTALHPDVEEAVGQALAVLSKLTAGLQDVVMPVSPNVNTTVVPAEALAFHAARVREAPQMFQSGVLERLRQGEAVDTPSYIERRRELDEMRRAVPGLFTHVDLLVTPTMPVLPVLIADARGDEASVALYPRNTRPFNANGLPAVSVPCGFSKSGLPIGLQIAGPPWGEESVIRLAYAYEQATDWHDRRPVL